MDGRRIYAWTSFARVAPFTGEMHEVGYVSTEGSTTPWSWARLRGLGNTDGWIYARTPAGGVWNIPPLAPLPRWRWLTSTRRPESRKP